MTLRPAFGQDNTENGAAEICCDLAPVRCRHCAMRLHGIRESVCVCRQEPRLATKTIGPRSVRVHASQLAQQNNNTRSSTSHHCRCSTRPRWRLKHSTLPTTCVMAQRDLCSISLIAYSVNDPIRFFLALFAGFPAPFEWRCCGSAAAARGRAIAL